MTWGTDVSEDAQIDPEKLRAALKAQTASEAVIEADDRKRKYNSLENASAGVTDEEMEAYRLRKGRDFDPLLGGKSGEDAGNGFKYV